LISILNSNIELEPSHWVHLLNPWFTSRPYSVLSLYFHRSQGLFSKPLSVALHLVRFPFFNQFFQFKSVVGLNKFLRLFFGFCVSDQSA
jgi:hypothetical protein